MFGRLSVHDAASTSSVGLAVAAVFFATAFVVAQLVVTQEDGREPYTATLDARASSALDVIVNGAGFSSADDDWTKSPDSIERFGLIVPGQPQFLDYDKVRAIRNGSSTTGASNNAPDYGEVRAALGITEGDFHLRSYPVLMSVKDARWQPDSNLRIAYFGHYSGASSPVEFTPSATVDSAKLNVSVLVTNHAAKAATFTVAISVANQTADDDIVTAERHTRLLLPGASQTVFASFHALPSWPAGSTDVRVSVTDPYGNAAVDPSGNVIGDKWLTSVPPPTSAGATYNHLLQAGTVYYQSGDTVKFVIDHYDKDIEHVNSAKAKFVLVGPDGKEWVNTTVDLPKQPNKVYTHSCTNCTTVGNYTAIVWNTALTKAQYEQVHVSAAAMFTEKQDLAPVALKEMGLLATLNTGFNATRYHSVTNPGGDVFGDDTNQANDMVESLNGYTTLVIGSEVSQTSLNPATIKYAIRDWVKDKGGNLVVLGTYEQQSRWLEPVFHAAQETAGGGISAPDPTHPILGTPDPIDYERYMDRGRAWRIKDGSEFTHVLNRGSTGNSQDDTLAVSTPGAFNDGTVVLTSYMPGSLTDPQDDTEALRLMNNLVSQGHSMLFIDYGPPIPDGVPIGSASRLVVVPHPNVPGVDVEVRVVMYLFG